MAVDTTNKLGPNLTWLNRYASPDPQYQWQTIQRKGKQLYHRPLGLVENLFDVDGRLFEGRADVSALLTLKVYSRLTKEELRSKILAVWARLRLQHILLRSKVIIARDFLSQSEAQARIRHFVIEQPTDLAELDREASYTTVFLEDHYEFVETHDFYRHAQNTARIIDPSISMSKLFVLPVEKIQNESNMYSLRLLLVAAHQITDGLTMHNWMSHMLVLLNAKGASKAMETLITEPAIKSVLPLAQETLYPPISGSIARRRWFWALTVILRHVHKPLPESFSNSLRTRNPRESGFAEAMAPTYDAVLDYNPDRQPPLNSFHVLAELSRSATHRHHRLCREAGVSIGAGSFALAAVAMMELEELKSPHLSDSQRKPFVVSFPLDPRAMFAYSAPPDSLMLAFSEGIVLPFLPSVLSLEGRFKLIAKRAHHQLIVYQKRALKTKDQRAEKNAVRVLATDYIRTAERAKTRCEELSDVDDPQGKYPMRPNPSIATHGVSSVGSYKWPLVAGAYRLDGGSDIDFVADFVGLQQGVRARDNEFLAAMGGNQNSLWAFVSYDGNAIDEEMATVWKAKMENLLETPEQSKL